MFYSLDLEPAGSLGTELSLIGGEPPGIDLELIATGTGVVCATDHVLTVAKAVTHPYYKPHVLTVAVPNAEGGWTLVPVGNCVMGDGKSELALLKVDKLPLKAVTFHESNDRVIGDVSILGFKRGADILEAGLKSENGSVKQSDVQALTFETTATID